MTYTGHCACGAVSAAISGEPYRVSQCWCRQCQQIAAGGATCNAVFPAVAVSFTGALTERSYLAASGSTATQAFCGQCGTPIAGYSSQVPELCAIKLGFIDEPHGLRPSAAIWTGEAPPWATIDPALAQFSGLPPSSPAKD